MIETHEHAGELTRITISSQERHLEKRIIDTKSQRSQGFRKLMKTQLVNIPKTLVPLILAALLGGIAPTLASATTININPSKDNTLYEFVSVDGDRSNALGDHFFAGMTADGLIRRGVLAFDIAG